MESQQISFVVRSNECNSSHFWVLFCFSLFSHRQACQDTLSNYVHTWQTIADNYWKGSLHISGIEQYKHKLFETTKLLHLVQKDKMLIAVEAIRLSADRHSWNDHCFVVCAVQPHDVHIQLKTVFTLRVSCCHCDQYNIDVLFHVIKYQDTPKNSSKSKNP